MPSPRRTRRTPTPHLSRDDLILEILRHLEHAGARGLTRPELLFAIGPDVTSLATIQRGLDELRSEKYEADIVYDAKTRRWRLESHVALPLEAPQPDDILAVLIARAILEPLVDASLLDRITKLIEGLDERARTRTSATKLPARKSVTSTLTLGTRMDPDVFRHILGACRRKRILIKHNSPWQKRADEVKLQEIEPWSVRVHDGAAYVRAWSAVMRAPRTYRIADIEASLDLDGSAAAPREQPPVDPWGDENPAFGIDHDRPNTAVIRLRGGVARWVSRIVWHPGERDVWSDDGEVLERTVAYRSCREMARRLASLLDGIESVEPPELCDELIALVANIDRLKRNRRARSASKRSAPSRSAAR